MNREYKPTSSLLRSFFFVAALTITVAIGAFIDTLASGYSSFGATAPHAGRAVVARA